MDDTTRTLPAGDGPFSQEAPRKWGPFEIRQKVGQGGFGEVYRAFDTTLQREVALKLLRRAGLNSEEDAHSVLREARQLAKIRHPNVVPVYGVDRHEGRVGFWSDFVRGKTLAALLAEQGPFGAQEAAGIGVELAKAVSAVHAASLLHCDIKPANAMREVGGRILLVDFGLTQARDEQGMWGGTPAYMAPELFAGEAASVATDIYALGVLLFQLLTGKYPYGSGSFEEVKTSQASGRPRRLLDQRPELDEALARVVETAMHADPKQRFASAGELISALAEAMGSATVVPEPATLARSRRLKPWMVAPAAAALAAAGYLAVWRGGTEALRPGGAHVTYLQAQEQLDHYYRPRGVDKAIELLQKTIGEDPQFALAYAGLARANFLQYWQLGDTRYIEPTMAAATRALALDRNLAPVHVTLGRLYTETGKSDLAAQELNEALRLDARNAEAYHGLAELYRKQGRTAEVEPALQRAIDLAPNDWRFPDELGYFLSLGGHRERAIGLHRRAVDLSPDNPRALNNLALAYWRFGRLEEARLTIEKAIAIEPGFNRLNLLGNILQNQGRYQDSIPAYQRAIPLNPTSYLVWGNLALAHLRTPGHRSEAMEAFGKATTLAENLRAKKPNDGTLLSWLGLYYTLSGNEAKGAPLMRQALALAPDDADVLFRAGLASELEGRRVETLDWIGKALRLGLPMVTVERYPELASLRSDKRFSQLAKQYAGKP